jgi:hypothetical protein
MEKIDRGLRAKALLADPMLQEALTTIEETLMETWTESVATDHREELWYTYQGAKRFKSYLDLVLQQGEAEQALKEKLDATRN